jgi:hypothetical protein
MRAQISTHRRVEANRQRRIDRRVSRIEGGIEDDECRVSDEVRGRTLRASVRIVWRQSRVHRAARVSIDESARDAAGRSVVVRSSRLYAHMSSTYVGSFPFARLFYVCTSRSASSSDFPPCSTNMRRMHFDTSAAMRAPSPQT